MDLVLTMLRRKFSAFITLDAADEAILRELLETRTASVRRGHDLIRQGDPNPKAFVVISGWAARGKALPDGRRQILSFIVPGDIVGLFAPVSPVATSSVHALTDLTVALLEPRDILQAMTGSPRLAAALAWTAAREKEIFAEHLLTLGRRTARERVAHIYVELWARLRLRGLANGRTLHVPVTQEMLSDVLGLSVVHVNRMLRQMARDGILTVRRHHVVIEDLARLQDVAGFDSDFLLQYPAPIQVQQHLEQFMRRPVTRPQPPGLSLS